MKILVACTGNSCRSQLAEGLLKSLKSGWEVHSGGTQAAAKVASSAIEVLDEIGIDISGNETHNLDEFDIKEFSHCIAFSEDAKFYLENKTDNLTYFEVDDPFFSGAETKKEELGIYRKTRDLIFNKLKNFIKNEVNNENCK